MEQGMSMHTSVFWLLLPTLDENIQQDQVEAPVQFAVLTWPSHTTDGELLQVALRHLTVGNTITLICCFVHKEFKVQIKW